MYLPNLDSFAGTWREGVLDGPVQYSFHDQSPRKDPWRAIAVEAKVASYNAFFAENDDGALVMDGFPKPCYSAQMP
eukprot:gene30351-36675_t